MWIYFIPYFLLSYNLFKKMNSNFSLILLIVFVFGICLCDDKKYALSDKQGGVPLEKPSSGKSEFLADSDYYTVHFSGDKEYQYKLLYHYKIDRKNENDHTVVNITSFKSSDSYIYFTSNDILYYNKERSCALKDLKYQLNKVDDDYGVSFSCDYIYKQLARLAIGNTINFYVNSDNEIVDDEFPDGGSMKLVDLSEAKSEIDLYYNPSSYQIPKSEGISGSIGKNVEVFDAYVEIYISDTRTYFKVSGKTGNTDLFSGLLRYDITRQNNSIFIYIYILNR